MEGERRRARCRMRCAVHRVRRVARSGPHGSKDGWLGAGCLRPGPAFGMIGTRRARVPGLRAGLRELLTVHVATPEDMEDTVPTYQYACTEAECGHAFEQFQNFTEDSLTVCPECDGHLRKVFNAVGVVFKGSGFYRTDSRSTPATGDTSGSASGSPSGSESVGAAPAKTGDSGTKGGAPSAGSSAPTAPAGAGAA
jgi:putative FmdB family regulatory protein